MKTQELFSGCADISKEWESPKDSAMTFVDLFAGCGGLSCGLQLAGLMGVAAVEYKESASITYARNFSHPVIYGDITQESTKARLYAMVEEATGGRGVDIVAGGPPCQGFSMAGKRIIDDERNKLYREFVEVVAYLKPRFFVMENVVGIKSMAGGAIIRRIISDFERLGYSVEMKVLNACDYYTPQLRKRIIIIGNRIGVRNLHPAPLLQPEEYMTVWDGIHDLSFAPENREFSQEYTKHGAEKVERISHLLPGEKLSKKYNGTLRRLCWDKPSYTVTYSNGNPDIHPERNSVLTIREMARLQSFPDEFRFYGSKEEQGVMVGNAVPPNLGKAIGLALCKMNLS